jgi:hypothetical protein
MMQMVAGFIFLAAFGAAAFGWLYVREHGRAYVWGRLAARCRANHEAAIVREERDRQFISEWIGGVR